MSFPGRLCVMARWPKRVNLLEMLGVFEHIIYFFVAIALTVPIALLFGSMVMSTLRVAEVGVLETVLAVLDRVLLVFIFVELLDTIRIIIRERGIVIVGPFLLVGLIAVVRRIFWSPPDWSKPPGRKSSKTFYSNWGSWRASWSSLRAHCTSPDACIVPSRRPKNVVLDLLPVMA